MSLRGLCQLGNDCGVHNVWIHLPTEWTHCVSSLQNSEETLGRPDILIQPYGSQIQSINARGCGEQGLEVRVPIQELYSLHTNKNTQLMNVSAQNENRTDQSTPSSDNLTLELLNWKFGLYMDSLSALDDNSTILSPTKQNVECDGRSPSQIIGMSSFTSSDYTQPQFKYTLTSEASGQHYVLVLDLSKRMEFNSRWRNIKRSLMRFIGNIPTGAMLSIITFGREGSLVLPPTVVTSFNREGLHGRIPRRTEDSNEVCISCGLQLAGDVLAGSKGSIILLTGGVDKNKMDDQKMYTILYPGSYDQIIDNTLYSIQENTARSPVTQMNEVLIDIINLVNKTSQLYKIHESNHQSYEFSGTFQLESDQQDAIVTLLIEDEQSVEYFEVINPLGEKNIFPKYEDGAVQVHLPASRKPGIWSYHAKLYPDTSIALHRMSVDVVVRSEEARVQVAGVPNPVIEDLSKPVPILAKVSLGEFPVHFARVTAVVSGPDTDTEFRLYDGNYPDVHVGDGIYTGYMTQFSTRPGYYTVRVIASDNNGQASTLQDGVNHPTGAFKYFITSSSFYINTAVTPGLDIIPPSRIIDLAGLPKVYVELEDNSTSNATVEESFKVDLKFTSPGDDYNVGKAVQYEIRCNTNPYALSNTNFSSHGTLVVVNAAPEPAGSLEAVTVPLPWTGENWYFAIVAIDAAGNRGSVSNLAKVFVPTPVEPEPQESSLFSGDNNLQLRSPSWFLNTEYMYILGGCIAGAILCVIILVIVLIQKSKKTAKPKYLQDDTYEPGFQPTEAGTKHDKTETESGIYSWLESLPRSEHGAVVILPPAASLASSATRISVQRRQRGCEEGSNSSRPTTSTDDSISDSGEPHHNQTKCPPSGDEVSQDDYANQLLTRSMHYYSTRARQSDRPQYNIQDERQRGHESNGSISSYPYVPPQQHSTPTCVVPPVHYPQYSMDHDQSSMMDPAMYRKKRHESVV